MSRAAELIQLGQSARMPFDLSHDTVDSMDMICGGQAEVFLDCVSPTAMNRTVFEQWSRMLGYRQKGSLITVFVESENKAGDVVHCLATPAGGIVGDMPLPDLEREKVLATAADSSAVQTLAFAGAFVVVEPTQRVFTAYLFGAGHVARSTAAMAAIVEFRVSVADDRAEYANRKRFCFPDCRPRFATRAKCSAPRLIFQLVPSKF